MYLQDLKGREYLGGGGGGGHPNTGSSSLDATLHSVLHPLLLLQLSFNVGLLRCALHPEHHTEALCTKPQSHTRYDAHAPCAYHNMPLTDEMLVSIAKLPGGGQCTCRQSCPTACRVEYKNDVPCVSPSRCRGYAPELDRCQRRMPTISKVMDSGASMSLTEHNAPLASCLFSSGWQHWMVFGQQVIGWKHT